MNKTLLIGLLLLFSCLQISAQCPECTGTGRYADSVFTCSVVSPNIQYGTGLYDWNWTHLLCLNLQPPPHVTQLPLFADFYEPCFDTAACRPLIIAVHGGAWLEGDKADAAMAFFCDQMAKRGYAVASVNYRLSLPSNPLCWDQDIDSVRLERAYFRAIQDVKAAVRFFRANAAEYRIDPDNIFLAGASAGGFTVIGAGYMDKESERPGAAGPQPQFGEWLGNLWLPDMGSIEGNGGQAGVSSAVRAVASMSGGVFSPDLFDHADAPPLLLFHGTADDIVPYDSGCVLQNAIDLNIFHNCINTFGSAAVQSLAQQAGMTSNFITFPGGGHGYTPAEAAIILEETTSFFCQNMLKTVGVDDKPLDPTVRVFPNPASDVIYLNIPEGKGSWHLYNGQGQLVRAIEIKEQSTTISRINLSPGVYFWHWQGEKSAVSGRLFFE